jgi:hypothetical protein
VFLIFAEHNSQAIRNFSDGPVSFGASQNVRHQVVTGTRRRFETT